MATRPSLGAPNPESAASSRSAHALKLPSCVCACVRFGASAQLELPTIPFLQLHESETGDMISFYDMISKWSLHEATSHKPSPWKATIPRSQMRAPQRKLPAIDQKASSHKPIQHGCIRAAF
eukprot:scaffold204817_cov21-Tisochrysis_lutea.AAC.1